MVLGSSWDLLVNVLSVLRFGGFEPMNGRGLMVKEGAKEWGRMVGEKG